MVDEGQKRDPVDAGEENYFGDGPTPGVIRDEDDDSALSDGEEATEKEGDPTHDVSPDHVKEEDRVAGGAAEYESPVEEGKESDGPAPGVDAIRDDDSDSAFSDEESMEKPLAVAPSDDDFFGFGGIELGEEEDAAAPAESEESVAEEAFSPAKPSRRLGAGEGSSSYVSSDDDSSHLSAG